MTKPVTQNNNTAGGHLVGGNLSITNVFSENSTLERLYEQFRQEAQSSSCDDIDFIDKLKHLTTKIDGELIGLSQKLSNANLDSILDDAVEYKETFYKLLLLHQHSLAAQEIYTHFLLKARMIFNTEVKLSMKKLEPEDKIALVRKRIVDEIYKELGSNALNIECDEILGMVFFLTGNCHITWR